MTPEGRGSGPPGPLDGTSLLVRSEQTNLDSLVSASYLARAGFSPRFPIVLMGLNNVLPPVSMSRFSFELYPGETPRIDARVEHTGGYRLSVDCSPISKRAEIALRGHGTQFRIADIKDFVRAIFPNALATLHACASPHVIRRIDDFDQDLQTITEEVLRGWFRRLPARKSSGLSSRGKSKVCYFDYPYGPPSAEVRIEGQRDPLLYLNFGEYQVDGENLVGCEISNSVNDAIAFYYSGKTWDAETVMEQLTELFDKRLFRYLK